MIMKKDTNYLPPYFSLVFLVFQSMLIKRILITQSLLTCLPLKRKTAGSWRV